MEAFRIKSDFSVFAARDGGIQIGVLGKNEFIHGIGTIGDAGRRQAIVVV